MTATRRRKDSLLVAPLAQCVLSIFVFVCLFLHWSVTTTNRNDFLSQSTTTETSRWQLPGLRSDVRKQLRLRLEYTHRYPSDRNRTRSFVNSLRNHNPTPVATTYNIYNCPQEPSTDYPSEWCITQVLENWNPDNATVPPQVYQSLCIFDYERDYEKALRYRQLELPFIVTYTPQILETAERWNRNGYLEQLLANEKADKVEHSRNHHFMYWKLRKNQASPAAWNPPTDLVRMSYSEWLSKARQQSQKDWYYFRFNAAYNRLHEFMYDELPFFNPVKSFFIVDPQQQRGINCRFGMKGGLVSAAHYDSSRNFIAILGGSRRYILAHPRECKNLELYGPKHPSGRHSSVDWTSPVAEMSVKFRKARVNEVVLQAGDALYLPTHWMHFIQSLDINYQCNARSGVTSHYVKHIQDCGFSK